MKQPLKISKTWLVTGVAAALALAYVMFVFRPGQRAIGELRQQISAKQQFIMQANRLTPAIASAADELQASHEFVTAWRQQAPSEGKLTAQFGQLTQQAQAAGLAVQRFDPQPVVKLDALCQAPVLIAGEGSFGQIFEFVRLIEALPGTVWIQSLHLEKGARDDGRLRCELTLVVFADNRDFSD